MPWLKLPRRSMLSDTNAGEVQWRTVRHESWELSTALLFLRVVSPVSVTLVVGPSTTLVLTP